ncbi:MAG TPA: hypothetical protein VD948_05770 [Rhodothermales bacterium]|nr:hypothetical protein [Rhodothermales bacterium]
MDRRAFLVHTAVAAPAAALVPLTAALAAPSPGAPPRSLPAGTVLRDGLYRGYRRFSENEPPHAYRTVPPFLYLVVLDGQPFVCEVHPAFRTHEETGWKLGHGLAPYGFALCIGGRRPDGQPMKSVCLWPADPLATAFTCVETGLRFELIGWVSDGGPVPEAEPCSTPRLTAA